ncbi:MAG: hypothetical protein V3S41_05065, partial [Spirochaetia bacterium]
VSTTPGIGSAAETARSITTIVLNQFGTLSEPSLRARVLAKASEMNLLGAEKVVLLSAQHLSDMMQDDGSVRITKGYEVEAMVLAAVATRYPSTVLAELLRTIAGRSGDRRVVSATRDAARRILLSLQKESPGSI